MRTTAISVDDVDRVVSEGWQIDEWAAEAIVAARDPASALEAFARLAARATLAFKDAVGDQKRLFEEMIRRAAAQVLEEAGSERLADPIVGPAKTKSQV
jgi:hypothetical protein